MGREDPEGFFGICVSVLGHEDTRLHFLSLIQPLSTAENQLHYRLSSIYREYFSKEEDEELELALALSLQDVKGHQQGITPLTPLSSLQGPGNSHMPVLNSTPLPNAVLWPQGATYAQLAATGGRIRSQQKCSTRTEDSQQKAVLKDTMNTNLPTPALPPGQPNEDERDMGQSEKPKRSRNRRQRRKGSGQQVVGLPGSPSAPPPVVLWFRRDLRLGDNPALIGALEAGGPVVPVFIWSPEEEEGPGVTVAMGGACKYHDAAV